MPASRVFPLSCIFLASVFSVRAFAELPDLSMLPPKSTSLEKGSNQLSNLLQVLHIQRESSKDLNQKPIEIPIGPDLLAAHFAMRGQHREEIRRKSREEILVLGLEFQDDLAMWICKELNEDQRKWLFSRLITQNGYQVLDCGWLVTALKIDSSTHEKIRAAVQEAAQRMKSRKPRSVANATPEARMQYAHAAKIFFQERRELENELIWPLLDPRQQQLIRNAENEAE